MNVTRKEMKKLIDTLRLYTVCRQDCYTAATLLEKHFLGPEYHHKKRGTNYTVVGVARLQFTDTTIIKIREWLDKQLSMGEHSEEVKIVLEVVCDNVDGIALEAGHIKDNDMLVLYRGDDGNYSVRPHHEFHDGRFVHITDKNRAEFLD